MHTKDRREDKNLKNAIESQGEYKLFWTSDSRFLTGDEYEQYVGKTQQELEKFFVKG